MPPQPSTGTPGSCLPYCFFGQFPHFLAIALMYREDYFRAGYRMLPRFDLDGRFTRGGDPWFHSDSGFNNDAAGGGSRWADLSAGGVARWSVSPLSRDEPMKSTSKVLARRLVHASVLYLPVVLGMMIVCKA